MSPSGRNLSGKSTYSPVKSRASSAAKSRISICSECSARGLPMVRTIVTVNYSDRQDPPHRDAIAS
jgi:hypothetical protein